MNLSEKLDWGPLTGFVPNKRLPVYNWLYFKEGFARDLPWNLLHEWQPKGLILDPFCGSGTTLLAAREAGLESFGADLLPLSILASRVKTRDWDTEQLRDQATKLFSCSFRKVTVDFPFKRYFNPHVLADIMLFREECAQLQDKDFFLLALITSAMKASWAWKDGTMLKVRKHPNPPFRKFFKHRVKKMIKDIERFPGTAPVTVQKTEPWNLPLMDNSVAAVITSPPYLNQIDYSRVYAIENWFLEPAKLPAYLGPVAEASYFEDMQKTLKELLRVMQPGARAGIVVGNAYFPKEDRVVEVDLMLAEQAEQLGFAPEHIFILNRRHALQHRTIKKGTVRESLIVLKKQ